MTPLPRLFPYFGGKLTILDEVQRRFGKVFRLIEPFAGSAAIGINYQPRPRYVILNDINGLIVNVWRSVKFDPDGVLEAADRPIAELELRAIHKRMMERAQGLPERLQADPDYYDSQIAGWWVWGQCGSMGQDWANENYPKSAPHFHHNRGILTHTPNQVKSLMGKYRDNLRGAYITCGDWVRVVSPSAFGDNFPIGIFLDPPYAADNIDSVYGEHDSATLAHDVRAWCLEHGADRRLKIALCGYDEHDELAQAGWSAYRWKASGGFGTNSGNIENRHRETVWFSPHCTNVTQGRMF